MSTSKSIENLSVLMTKSWALGSFLEIESMVLNPTSFEENPGNFDIKFHFIGRMRDSRNLVVIIG